MAEKNETTHTLLDRELIVYRRERSNIWQCRFKVDGIWQRASTKERDLKKAKTKANELRIEAEIRKRSNLPLITHKFNAVKLKQKFGTNDKRQNRHTHYCCYAANG